MDPATDPDINTLRRILSSCKTIAVVGLSDKWHRPSYFAAKYLLEHGYDIIPVNPNHRQIFSRPCFRSIDEVPQPIDVVNVFQKPDAVEPVAKSAIRIGAKVLWLQLGVIHQTAAQAAAQAGLDVVMDRCMKIEHARLYGGLNFIGVDTSVVSSSRPRWLP